MRPEQFVACPAESGARTGPSPLPSNPPMTSTPVATALARPKLRWVVLQAFLVPPLFFLGALVIEATFPIPLYRYQADHGPVPLNLSHCDAVFLPGKRGLSPSCATFGSVETNPAGFAALGFGLSATVLLLALSVRPGRGLRFGRKPEAN